MVMAMPTTTTMMTNDDDNDDDDDDDDNDETWRVLMYLSFCEGTAGHECGTSSTGVGRGMHGWPRMRQAQKTVIHGLESVG